MDEKETICPYLAIAAIIKWGTIYEFQDEGGVSKSFINKQVKCLGEKCQMWDTGARRCGIIR